MKRKHKHDKEEMFMQILSTQITLISTPTTLSTARSTQYHYTSYVWRRKYLRDVPLFHFHKWALQEDPL